MDADRLDQILIGGREQREIVIVAYEQSWPACFEQQRRRIAAALGTAARSIEHIGSTSVPGLGAKPIIDVLVTVSDPENDVALVGPLERAGYNLRVRESGHRMFRTAQRDVHVHVYAHDDPEAGRVRRFRDRLRASPRLRTEYERLKRELASRRWQDMNHYADAKGPFIERVLADE